MHLALGVVETPGARPAVGAAEDRLVAVARAHALQSVEEADVVGALRASTSSPTSIISIAILCGMRDTRPAITPPKIPTLASG